ncbi:hypothetical protein L1049_003829 [Liquidambar formosana]|uniref:Uncharacterized protein n=1 Tax=Liquidambar formosana TaxID=63359 RepID=A0AAP0RN25_LIQFO
MAIITVHHMTVAFGILDLYRKAAHPVQHRAVWVDSTFHIPIRQGLSASVSCRMDLRCLLQSAYLPLLLVSCTRTSKRGQVGHTRDVGNSNGDVKVQENTAVNGGFSKTPIEKSELNV